MNKTDNRAVGLVSAVCFARKATSEHGLRDI